MQSRQPVSAVNHKEACVPPWKTTAPHTDSADKSYYCDYKKMPSDENNRPRSFVFFWIIFDTFQVFFFLVCLSGSVLYACLPCPSFKKQSIPCKGRLVLVSGCLRPLFCCGWQHMTSRAKWEAGEGVRSGSPFLELDTNLALRKKRGEAEFRNSSGSRVRLAGYLVQERQVKLSQ